ncbi:hypothetical protein GCM10011588_20610 [Nocardia jinanensis]|uniref:Uncharacterized protein n=2 Tax=Nocardia jinanensis TaxID=382504 RepID=A0A917RGU8_9NOCA|nr:hypothetical protein GCM10011588_20610 [Nocardia jinanensis]
MPKGGDNGARQAAEEAAERVVNALGHWSRSTREGLSTGIADRTRRGGSAISAAEGDAARQISGSDPGASLGSAGPGAVSPATARARGRDLIDEVDYVSLWAKRNDSGPGDRALAEIYRMQGFDGLPTVTGPAEVDKIVKAGSWELFRGVAARHGVSAREYAEQFRSGPYLPGRTLGYVGVGNGTWVTPLKSEAVRYAAGDAEGVVRMALPRRGVRIGAYGDLAAEQSRVLAPIEQEIRQFKDAGARVETSDRLWALEDKRAVLDDAGRFAALRGYDAYTTPWRNAAGEYWIVLNRTALVVER